MAKNDKRVYDNVKIMNPLLSLWLFVVVICTVLGGVFYLADNYPHIIGNFYFLLSVFLISYGIYLFINWRKAKKAINTH